MEPAHIVPAVTPVGKQHTIPWLWPWLTGLSLFPTGMILNTIWGQAPTWPAVGLTVAVLVLTVLAWKAGTARGPLVRGHAAISIAATGLWLLMATITGPTAHPTRDVWVVLLLAGGISWNVHRALRRGDGGPGSSGWEDVGAQVGLARSRVMSARSDGPRVHATVEVGRGTHTAADVTAGTLRRIASYYGLPGGHVTASEDHDDAGVAHLTLVTKDLLAAPIRWPGLSAPGASIAEPIVIGLRENGDPLTITLPAQPRRTIPAQHVLISGMNGAGKSRAGLLIAAEVASRRDAELYLIDTVKGAQFLGPFIGRERVTIYRDERDAKQAIERLLARIAERAEFLGGKGLEGWQPGCGLLYEVWLAEEAAASVGSLAAFARAAQRCRSVGISLIASQQRVTTANLTSDARRQMGTVLQFGCQAESRLQDYALGEAVMAAGATPHHWGNRKPGYVYAQVPGVDPRLWHQPARVFDATPAAITAALTGHQAPTGSAAETSPLEAKAQVLARLRELGEEGRAVLRPADFEEVRLRIGRSKAWMSGALKQLVEGGVLTGGDGIYMLATGDRGYDHAHAG